MACSMPLLTYSGLRETELQAILPGDKALSQYNSFIGKMILKKTFSQ